MPTNNPVSADQVWAALKPFGFKRIPWITQPESVWFEYDDRRVIGFDDTLERLLILVDAITPELGDGLIALGRLLRGSNDE